MKNITREQKLRTWFTISDHRQRRCFLEENRELLSTASLSFLAQHKRYIEEQWKAQAIPNEWAKEATHLLSLSLYLLHDIQARGSTREAICASFVNIYGGMTLDLPKWLEALASLVEMNNLKPEQPDEITTRIRMLYKAISYTQSDTNMRREILAELQVSLGLALLQQSSTIETLEKVVPLCEAALHTYTYSSYPFQYARLHDLLGSMYFELGEEGQDVYLEKAFEYYKKSLQVYTKHDFPWEWAKILASLGSVYTLRTAGERERNLEQAIRCLEDALSIYSSDDSSILWATLQNNLGTAYMELSQSNQGNALEHAIACFRNALKVFSHEIYPVDWAKTQSKLASALLQRIEGEHQQNIREAIRIYQAASTVLTHHAFTLRWARIQHNLGAAYLQLYDEEGISIEQAIKHLKAALQTHAYIADQTKHSNVQINLGMAFSIRNEGDPYKNVEQAITYFETALGLRSQSIASEENAKIAYNLGLLYQKRAQGTRKINTEKAITYFQKALCIYSQEGHPMEWAASLIGLSSAYTDRIEGDKEENNQTGRKYLEAAVQVYTLEAFPEKWAMSQLLLGDTYLEQLTDDQWSNIKQALTYYELALRVFTREDFPEGWAISQSRQGNTYCEWKDERWQEHLENAIARHQAALQIFTHKSFPNEYANTLSNLGNAYRHRIHGEKQANQEEAIRCYMLALQVHTVNFFPEAYARTQNNLGNIYVDRIQGSKRANGEYAIACFKAVLEIFTYEDYPQLWAETQTNVAHAQLNRIEGNLQEHVRQAISYCKAALQVLTRETSPKEFARTLIILGNAYSTCLIGEERANIEQAIVCYEKAAEVYAHHVSLPDYAEATNGLGNAYLRRIDGKRWMNIEKARRYYLETLRIHTRENFPVDYAKALNNLAITYMSNEPTSDIEQAIQCYKEALQIYTREEFPTDYAMTLTNLATAYQNRLHGDRTANIEQAIVNYQEVLQIYTCEDFPIDYARTHINIGNASRVHKGENHFLALDSALAHYKTALKIYTPDIFPSENRLLQLLRAETEIERGNWSDAHEAYIQASNVEDMLLILGTGVHGHDAVLQRGRNAAVNDGFVLARLGEAQQAALAIERGRARGLAESLLTETVDPTRVLNKKQQDRYVKALQTLRQARSALDGQVMHDVSESMHRQITLERMEVCRQAQEDFAQILKEIREMEDPAGFLEDSLSPEIILQAVEECGPSHAIVYLAATSWGGIAVAALSPNGERNTQECFATLELPYLTDIFVDDLIETHVEGDIQHVLNSFGWAQEGKDNALKLLSVWKGTTFREQAEVLNTTSIVESQESTLNRAAQKVLVDLPYVVNQPLEELSSEETKLLADRLNHYFLEYELARCLNALGTVALNPVVTWLHEKNITGLTLIPCGKLGAFPLTAVPLDNGYTVNEIRPTSVAPSARSLLRSTTAQRARIGVYTVGDPRPTHQPLLWGEAEAFAIIEEARRIGIPGKVRVRKKATRDWVLQALYDGYVVDLSCHGSFDTQNFLQSGVQLAKKKRLTLADTLSHTTDLQGLRLLILSACQTALLDLRGATDEVRSLAAGMLEAGAKAILASLWSVDDKATYLLMVRFAQEWFPHMKSLSPALALARAQHWLRTVTNEELRLWRKSLINPTTTLERGEAGVEFLKTDLRTDRGDRLDTALADTIVRSTAEQQQDPSDHPYANPIYWAGFQLMGW